ncbi:MAG: hypothetical protein JNK79_00770 [Chitinophagaceae bacterium]|nr:hypothetical protein [Chitinophagaceae bacterium]
MQRLLRRPFFIRLFHWEYWSFGAVYTWIYPIWIFLAFRTRSFFFFAAANPSIKNGGFLSESKKDIHDIMPPRLYPPTMHFTVGESGDKVAQQLRGNGFDYPLIGKPDTGGRGRGVVLLANENELRAYTAKTTVDFHIQKFIPYKNEAGIFYYRYPGEKSGRVSGIVRKEFLTVTGDGKSTIRELLLKNDRFRLQIESLANIYGEYLENVLTNGEEKLLVPYGNHARGAKFLDDSHLVDAALEQRMNDICLAIKDFYFGRLDIKYDNWEDFKQGKKFSVIEVNGAGAEPTHIYDPRHSIFFAWKEIVRHWFILNKISRMNHKRGHKYLTASEGLAMFRQDKEQSKKLLLMKD